jgi:hypothetical protein
MEFISSNLFLYKKDIEEIIKKENIILLNETYIENSSLNLNLEKKSEKKNEEKKSFKYFFDNYNSKFKDISDDIIRNNYIDNEFKKNFLDKFLEFNKIISNINPDNLNKEYEVKIKIKFI